MNVKNVKQALQNILLKTLKVNIFKDDCAFKMSFCNYNCHHSTSKLMMLDKLVQQIVKFVLKIQLDVKSVIKTTI